MLLEEREGEEEEEEEGVSPLLLPPLASFAPAPPPPPGPVGKNVAQALPLIPPASWISAKGRLKGWAARAAEGGEEA